MSMGPTLICSLGPIREASLPERAESKNITAVKGSSAIPALNAL